jgi:hypothetical protein
LQELFIFYTTAFFVLLAIFRYWWRRKERNGKARSKKQDRGAEKMLTKGKNRKK